MIVVRPMAAEYLEAVLSLEVATPEAPHWGRVAYERVLSADSKTAGRRAAWVALDGHELQGFAAAHLIVDVCELELIVVAESARRQGIGTILLDAVMTWALASRSSSAGSATPTLFGAIGSPAAKTLSIRAGAARGSPAEETEAPRERSTGGPTK
jgi:GNAT superfamily N-acetyltransferase